MMLNIRHTGLVVKNLRNSIRFYRDFLGMKLWKTRAEKGAYIEKVVGIRNVKIKWAKLKAGNGSVIELLQYMNKKGPKKRVSNYRSDKPGCSHVAFTVDNIGTFYDKMKKRGYHCVNKPQLSPDGRAKVMYCHDPDGIILEVVEEI
ncbi:MAG: VOC family protein [Elusimicrobiota bacterium]